MKRHRSKSLMIVVIITINLFFNCSGNKDQKLNDKEIALLSNVMKKMISREERMGVSFLVNPYFGHYEFNSYFKRIAKYKTLDSIPKQKVLEKINLNQESFTDLQKKIDDKYQGLFYDELLDLSKSDSSNWVVTFLGINKDLFFMEVVRYCDTISKEDLRDILIEQQPFRAEIHSLFILIENDRIKEIISGESVHTEKCI